MFFAIMAFLTATVAFGSFQGYKEAGAAAAVFSKGLATFMNQWGLDSALGEGFGVAYGSVFLTLMALTIMYLVVRFMRVASAEFMGESVPLFKNTTFGTIVALLLSALLIYTGFWARIWVLFGGANQLMAALALLLVSLWLMSKGKSYLWTFIPFIFMFITTVAALLITAYNVIKQVMTTPNLPIDKVIGNWLAGLIAIYLVIAAVILAVDAIKALMIMRTKEPAKAKV